jgi:hypothetical protein
MPIGAAGVVAMFMPTMSLFRAPSRTVVGEIAPRVVCRFGVAPVLGDARRRIGRIAREQLLDRRERQLQLAQHHDKACLVELGCVVVAIARRLIDARRHQHPALVVEAERLQ